MAPKSDSAEAIVLNYVIEQNRPLNSQNVADALQRFNLKKSSVQKSLDSLSDGNRISFKEYGKQKIYLARQDSFHIPSPQELASIKDQNSHLQQTLSDRKKSLADLESEIKALQSNLTLKQIREKEEALRGEAEEMEGRLEKLRGGGAALVNPADRDAVERAFSEMVAHWRKRKRMFRDLWDAITENSPKDLKQFKEELGVEYDEDAGVTLQSVSDLLQRGNKRPRR